MNKPNRMIQIFANQQTKNIGNLFGIFFEDISHAADGGLYAEMVQNRSFEFDRIDNAEYHSLYAWEKVLRGRSNAEVHVETIDPIHFNNQHYVVLEVLRSENGAGIRNLGFNSGLAFKVGETYRFSCFYRRRSSNISPIIVRLENENGSDCYGEISFTPESTTWQNVEMEIASSGEDNCGRLVILCHDKIAIALDMISLFPVQTFHHRKNGLRKDLAELIADMKPKFMRFPGGCLSHYGSTDETDRTAMYRWKNTLGPIEKRPTRRNPGNYNQTLGMGFYELFLFCEDIGAEPLPVIAAGYDPHTLRAVPLEDMQPWIDEALDLIEFANGNTSTQWGEQRAMMGHPEPFNLKYLGIGNEEIGEEFYIRFAVMLKAIKEKYPEITVIGSAGPGPAGGEFDRAWNHARTDKPDLMDEHYYQGPEWFLQNIGRYDHYSVDDAKVFLGEYGSHDDRYYNALAEAAFMIHLEKAPSVALACYAPMLCNTDYQNWFPNLIMFDQHRTYGTACYYVQKLFMRHQGDHLLKIEASGLQRLPQKPVPIHGTFGIETDQAHIDVFDITVKNDDTGEMQRLDDVSISPDNKSAEFGTTFWDNYTISFQARKNDEDSGANISGSRWYSFYYGKTETENRTWVMDWWMNLATNRHSIEGSMYEIVSHRFFPEPGRIYRYQIAVNGCHLKTRIDGELYMDTTDSPPIIEELYYTASTENSTGDIIVKAVNVQNDDVEVVVNITGLEKCLSIAEIDSIAGYSLDERNSYENPTKITSKKTCIELSEHQFPYVFPARSVTIMRLH